MSAYYEMRPFNEVGDELPTISRWAKSDAAIIGQAGTLAKANKGPVDIARDTEDDAPWDQRYITSVMPSEFHAKGFRCERLS